MWLPAEGGVVAEEVRRRRSNKVALFDNGVACVCSFKYGVSSLVNGCYVVVESQSHAAVKVRLSRCGR